MKPKEFLLFNVCNFIMANMGICKTNRHRVNWINVTILLISLILWFINKSNKNFKSNLLVITCNNYNF